MTEAQTYKGRKYCWLMQIVTTILRMSETPSTSADILGPMSDNSICWHTEEPVFTPLLLWRGRLLQRDTISASGDAAATGNTCYSKSIRTEFLPWTPWIRTNGVSTATFCILWMSVMSVSAQSASCAETVLVVIYNVDSKHWRAKTPFCSVLQQTFCKMQIVERNVVGGGGGEGGYDQLLNDPSSWALSTILTLRIVVRVFYVKWLSCKPGLDSIYIILCSAL